MLIRKNNDSTKSHTILTKHLDACKTTLIFLLGLSLITNLLILAQSLYSLQVLDRVISSGSIHTLLFLTLILVLALIALSLINYSRVYALIKIGEWLDKKISPELITHTISVNARTGANLSGNLYLRDLGSVKGFLTGPTILSLIDSPFSIIFIIVIFAIHPILGFLTLASSIILVTLAVLNNKVTKPILDSANELFLKSLNKIDIASRNADVVEAMGMLKFVIKSWEETGAKSYLLQTNGSKKAAIFSEVSKLFRMLIQMLVTGIGAYLALKNEMSVGGIIAGSILVGKALVPFEVSITSWNSFITARKSFLRLQSSLKAFTDNKQESIKLPEPEGRLSVENVSYLSSNTKKTIIRNINFQLQPGEILGLIGPSASGKSTLARIVTGVWKPATGVVRLDGADMYSMNKDNMGLYIGYIPQDVELFDGSIKENIARMNYEIDSEGVISAARMTQTHDMILRLPDGYETEIGGKGLVLSAGQSQRIGLARAFYGSPKLVVLDEPNANLDNEGDVALANTIKLAREKKITTIIISHKPSIMSVVDKILVLNNGAVEMFGQRDEILRKLAENRKQVLAIIKKGEEQQKN